jgi:hypothetical protein
MTVNNTTASLNEPLQIYQYDRGITLRIQVLKYKYIFDKVVQENVISDSSIISARALVQKPDGVTVFECPRTSIEEDVVVIKILLDWTDQFIEIGKYKLQIQLYGSDHVNERVTLPPVEFIVAPLLGFVAEEGVEFPALTNYAIADVSPVDARDYDDDSQLEQGIYDQTIWQGGDIIFADNLNKIEDAVEYLVRTQKAKAIFTPSVNEDGDLSWTNDLELENPETVNIKGEKGDKGDKFTYDDLTSADKADLTQGFITCSNIKRIELVSVYPINEEEGVLYIKIGD